MALLSNLLDEYQKDPNNPMISEEVDALRRRVINIYNAFENIKHLQMFSLDQYTYEAVARLALELHKRGVNTEQFHLAASLPARLDLYNSWFNFYDKDPSYQETRDDLLTKADLRLQKIDTTDPQRIIQDCQKYWSDLNTETDYTDKAFVYLQVIENLMTYIMKAAIYAASDQNAFSYVENCLNLAGKYLLKDIDKCRVQHGITAPHDLAQLKSDLQYLRLFLEYRTRINVFCDAYKATLASYCSTTLTEQQRQLLATPNEDMGQALPYACNYLDIDYNEILDPDRNSSDLIAKHISTMERTGQLDPSDGLEQKLYRVFEEYNLSTNRLYTASYNRFAASADLILALYEQFGLQLSRNIPATWVIAYELLYKQDIKIKLPRISDPQNGYYEYSLRSVAKEMIRDRISIQKGKTIIYDFRHDLLAAYFSASMLFYQTGSITHTEFIRKLSEAISCRLSETLLVYDCNECAELALGYLAAFLKFLICGIEE